MRIYFEHLWSLLFFYVHVLLILVVIPPQDWISYNSPKTMVGEWYDLPFCFSSHLILHLHPVENLNRVLGWLDHAPLGGQARQEGAMILQAGDVLGGRWSFGGFSVCGYEKHSPFPFPSNDIVDHLGYLGQHVIISTFATFVWTFS